MWTCPKCGTKVDQDFEVCWSCGTTADGVEDPSFVHADDLPPIRDPIYDPEAVPPAVGPGPGLTPPLAGVDPADLVEAYQAFSLMEAKFLADQLGAEGIPALSDTQDMQDFLGTLDGNPRVYVRRDDLGRARAWLASYEEKRKSDHGHPHHRHED